MYRRESGKCQDALLILTYQSRFSEVVDHIKRGYYKDCHLCGVGLLDAKRTGEWIAGVEIVTDQDTLISYICRQWIDEVLVVLPSDIPYTAVPLDSILQMGVTVHMKLAQVMTAAEQAIALQLPASYDIRTGCVPHLGEGRYVTIREYRISQRQANCKRVLDIAGSLIGCVCTGLLTIVVGPIIFLNSPGPIFFSQIRIGKNGRRFRMYKFRSMYMDAEERKKELQAQNLIKDGHMFKVRHDPRIIGGDEGIGGFIRRHSIDEFPQFWNVLRGDMSLVGTRPPTLDEWERYEPHHRARLAMKPGITGMWQVSGRSDVTDFEEVVKLDTDYISRWNLWLDVKILWKTLWVITGKRGAM